MVVAIHNLLRSCTSSLSQQHTTICHSYFEYGVWLLVMGSRWCDCTCLCYNRNNSQPVHSSFLPSLLFFPHYFFFSSSILHYFFLSLFTHYSFPFAVFSSSSVCSFLCIPLYSSSSSSSFHIPPLLGISWIRTSGSRNSK